MYALRSNEEPKYELSRVARAYAFIFANDSMRYDHKDNQGAIGASKRTKHSRKQTKTTKTSKILFIYS